MTKADFISRLATEAGINKTKAEQVIDSFADILRKDVLAKGDTLNIPGLGVFKQKHTAERTGRNIKTGMPLVIPAKTKLAFKQSSVLK